MVVSSKRVPLLVLISFVMLFGHGLQAADNGKEFFRNGEKLLKDHPAEAYEQFQTALRKEPSNRKYSAKLQEAGKLASAQMEALGEGVSQTNLESAKSSFESALRYDPS